LPLYFADNNGIYLVSEDIDIPILAFDEHNISPINDFGFYSIYLFGHFLYIEVTPRAVLTREIYLKNEAKKIVGSGFATTAYLAFLKMKIKTGLFGLWSRLITMQWVKII
jgi:hypothetical protein